MFSDWIPTLLMRKLRELSHLPQVSQLVIGRTGIWTRAFWFQSLSSQKHHWGTCEIQGPFCSLRTKDKWEGASTWDSNNRTLLYWINNVVAFARKCPMLSSLFPSIHCQTSCLASQLLLKSLANGVPLQFLSCCCPSFQPQDQMQRCLPNSHPSKSFCSAS